MSYIQDRVGQQNAIRVVASAFGGSLTAENAVNATNVLGGIASITQLQNSGVSTFSGDIRLTGQFTSSGITTLANLGGITTTGGDLYIGGDLYVRDDLSFDEFTARQINITGVTSTLNLNVTGVSTFTGEIDANGSLNVAGVTTFNDDVKFNGASSGMLWDKSANDLILYNNTRLIVGSNDDFQIWHGGTHTFLKNTGGDLRIRGNTILLKNENGDEKYLEANNGSSVDLYFNDDKKFATTGAGATVYGTTESQQLIVSGVSTLSDSVNFTGANYNALWDKATSKLKFYDSAQAVFGDGNDLQIYSDGTSGIIKGNDATKITGITELTVARVDVTGVTTFNDSVRFPDDKKLHFGNISGAFGDLQIWHDAGSHSYIRDQGSGDIRIYGSGLDIRKNDNSASIARFDDDGLVLTGDSTFSGNVTIGGTVTYEDVSNVDSVGLVTARTGVRITTGGLVVTAGVSTFVQDVSITTGDLTVSTGDVTVSSGDLTITSGDLNAGADIFVADNIRHTGDTDTYIEFNDDKIRLMAGGKGILTVQESSVDTVIVNDGSNNCDFRVEGLNDEHLIFSDGSTDRVGIGSAIPTQKLDVVGNVKATTYYGDGSNLTNVGVPGISTSGTSIFTNLNVTGVSTFTGIGTFVSDLYVGGDLYIKDDLEFDEFTARNATITGILTAATANVTGTLTAGLIDGGTY